MKNLKDGDVYFENEILKVVYHKKPTELKNDRNKFYEEFEFYFLGSIIKLMTPDIETCNMYIKKRIDAYNLIPDGCKIIPAHLVGNFRGMFIGGILEDSIIRVYGLAEPTIRGFHCSVFFIPSEEHLKSIMNYDSIEAGLSIKGESL